MQFGIMDSIKERLVKELEHLSPDELLAVYQLIERFRHSRVTSSAPRGSVERVRAALAHLPGSLADTIASERADRI